MSNTYRIRVTAFVVLLLAWAPLVASEPMPSLLEPPVPSAVPSLPSDAQLFRFPSWVSAERVFLDDGRVDRSLFNDFSADIIERRLRTLPPLDNGCAQLGAARADVGRPYRENLPVAIERAGWVIVGRVTGKAYGFASIIPGQLVRFHVEHEMRGQAPRDRSLFVFFPVGEFESGDHTVCADDTRYPYPPEIGDRLLLVLDRVQGTRDPFFPLVDTAQHTGIVVLPEGGDPRMPKTYGHPPRDKGIADDAEGMMGWVESVLAGSQGGVE